MSESGVGGFRVTERDVEIVRWIGRQRFVEAGQIARRFGMHERPVYRRLRGLATLGLLAHRRVFHGRPGAYWATRAGLRATGVRLPVAGIDIRTYDHDRIATTIAIELEAEFGANAVLTERELRSRDTAVDQPTYSVRGRRSRLGPRGLHFPDLAVDRGEGSPLVVEVELTAKGRTRLESIVAAYVAARHIGGVRYYASIRARTGVEKAVARAGATDLFDIRAVDDHPQ